MIPAAAAANIVSERVAESVACVTLHLCRAETTRILLDYGGIPFEDVAFSRESWPELKPKTPFGQVPVLEVSDCQGCKMTRAAGPPTASR